MDVSIIPQVFKFEKKHLLANEESRTITSYTTSIELKLNLHKADKLKIKKDLQDFFNEVLEYFD